MIKECKMRLVEFGTIKALVTVYYGDLELRGFKIIDHEAGKPWLAMPSKEFQKNGERQFINVVRIHNPTKRKEFTDWVLSEYKKALDCERRIRIARHSE